MAKFLKWSRFGALSSSLGAMLFLAACNSLPEDASIPHLEIQSVAFDSEDKADPHFIIDYTLSHASPEALQLLELKANVFIKGELAANLQKPFKMYMVEPNQKQSLQLEVPINMMSPASVDSLINNSLVILQGSCALQAVFSKDQSSFNPSDSYVGFIRSAKNNEFNVDAAPLPYRENLTPQASTKPLPRPEPKVDPNTQTDATTPASTGTQNTTTNQAVSGQSATGQTVAGQTAADQAKSNNSTSTVRITGGENTLTNSPTSAPSNSQTKTQTNTQSTTVANPHANPQNTSRSGSATVPSAQVPSSQLPTGNSSVTAPNNNVPANMAPNNAVIPSAQTTTLPANQ